ncbi:MAG: TM2 domain-containing protein [Asgard group archaeon]|nr:TM2 domain-containing protein [Asgard group archaeon]
MDILLSLFLGYLGVHRFMRGYTISGLVYLFTGGLFFVGYVLDLVFIINERELVFAK